jgi:transposase-like protein
VARYGKAYPKAAQTLCRDWERLVAFYSFPKDHWRHLRTTDESQHPVARTQTGLDAGVHAD